MPLLASRLGTAIASELKTQFNTGAITVQAAGSSAGDVKAVVEGNLDKMGTAIANAVVAELQANLSGATQSGGSPAHIHTVSPGDLG